MINELTKTKTDIILKKFRKTERRNIKIFKIYKKAISFFERIYNKWCNLLINRKSSNLFVTLVAMNSIVCKVWTSGLIGFTGRSRRTQVAHTALAKLIGYIISKKGFLFVNLFFRNNLKISYRKYIIPYMMSYKISYKTIFLSLRVAHGFRRQRRIPHKKWTALRSLKKRY